MKKLLKILIGLSMIATVSAQTNLSQGGTGWNTSTKGDLLVGTSSTLRYTRLPIGSTGNVLWVSNGQPAWTATSTLGITASVASSTIWNTLSATYPIQFDNTTGIISTGFSTSTRNAFTQLNTFALASTTALTLSGRVYDLANSAGTAGMVLQTSGNAGAVWVATNTLGFLPFASSTLYVPYTGATGKVDLGSQTLTTTGLITSTSSVTTNATSTTGWFSSLLQALSVVFTNGTSTNWASTNATVTNGTTTNLFATNASSTNFNFTNGTSSNTFVSRWATSTTFFSTTLSATSGTSTNWGATNLNWTNATGTNINGTNLNYVNSTSTNFATTNDTVTNSTTTTASFTTASSSSFFGTNAYLTGKISIASSTPANSIEVATGSILVSEFLPNGTSTAMTFDWRNGNSAVIRYGVANVVVTFSNVIGGQIFRLITCAPPTGTPGTIFFSTSTNQIYWSGGSLPASTATVKKCDVWSFVATAATSSTVASPVIFGIQSPNF